MEIRKEGGLRGAGAPDEARLAKINAYARTPLTAEAVYCFRVRLCDDRPDRDFERFDTAALPRMAELFRGKTGCAVSAATDAIGACHFNGGRYKSFVQRRAGRAPPLQRTVDIYTIFYIFLIESERI